MIGKTVSNIPVFITQVEAKMARSTLPRIALFSIVFENNRMAENFKVYFEKEKGCVVEMTKCPRGHWDILLTW